MWAYDFVLAKTREGLPLRLLVVVDEWTRECLSIDVARQLGSDDVLERLSWLMATRGVPDHVRSDNGSEFTATAVREWLGKVGVKTLCIEPGNPWENGYVESLNGKLRDELLNGEIFYTVAEARVLIERWREHYNRVRPHSALGYRPPVPSSATRRWRTPSCRSSQTMPMDMSLRRADPRGDPRSTRIHTLRRRRPPQGLDAAPPRARHPHLDAPGPQDHARARHRRLRPSDRRARASDARPHDHDSRRDVGHRRDRLLHR